MDGGGQVDELVVPAGDGRYEALRTGLNRRWVADPDRVCLPADTAGVVRAVQRAVDAGARIGVRGGGQGYRDFAQPPGTRVLLDLAELAGVRPDPVTGTIAVGGGTRLGPLYETLHRRWGTTLPAGNCLGVGVGGHVPGGGFGLLSRRDGLVVDHLYGVEVVVVDAAGRARAVLATREPDDPHHDLWWAHTGGGGGSFGVVTRFLFRSPGVAAGAPPDRLLPAAPAGVLVSNVFLPWDGIDADRLARLATNYSAWYARHRDPDARTDQLSGYLILSHRATGTVSVLTHHYGADEAAARRDLDAYLAEILAGTGLAPADTRPYTHPVRPRRLPYPHALRMVSTGSAAMNDPSLRGEYKSAHLTAPLRPAQLAALHRHLAGPEQDNPNCLVMLMPYGGRIGAVDPGVTAAGHREAGVTMLIQTLWADPAQDDAQVGWARGLYADLFGGSGGVPVPDGVAAGCYVNYPDTDLGDPAVNRSGVPWSTLYFGAGYPRLQRVKQAYDPLDVFRHAQSVRLPAPVPVGGAR